MKDTFKTFKHFSIAKEEFLVCPLGKKSTHQPSRCSRLLTLLGRPLSFLRSLDPVNYTFLISLFTKFLCNPLSGKSSNSFAPCQHFPIKHDSIRFCLQFRALFYFNIQVVVTIKQWYWNCWKTQNPCSPFFY